MNRWHLLESLFPLLRKRIPGQLVIQFTDHCNARCPQCGMRATESFPRHKLPADDVKRVIDAAAERGVKVVSFTGGEPLLFLDELAMLMTYAGQAGIEHIRTGTNGFVFRKPNGPHFDARVKRTVEVLAATPVRNFWISIDSAIPSVHEQMRGFPGVIEGIEKALPIFHEHGIYPSANLGINRNVGGAATKAVRGPAGPGDTGWERSFHEAFRTAFQRFFLVVIELGFTIINTCYPMSIDHDGETTGLDAVYAASSADSIVDFSQREKAILFKALFDTVPAYRSRIRIFSPMASLYALCRQYMNGNPTPPYACRGGIDFFFVDAQDGNTYPCGYRGKENLGKFWNLDIKNIQPQPDCLACDWECFRDPSELFGPILQGIFRPLDLFRKLNRDHHYFHLWVKDLAYYQACDFFHGRRKPHYGSMRRRARTDTPHQAFLPQKNNH